jgi:hypothetical protein
MVPHHHQQHIVWIYQHVKNHTGLTVNGVIVQQHVDLVTKHVMFGVNLLMVLPYLMIANVMVPNHIPQLIVPMVHVKPTAGQKLVGVHVQLHVVMVLRNEPLPVYLTSVVL